MTDIASLQRRIAAAFDTIEASLGRLPDNSSLSELEDARIELEAERKASTLLEERVTAMRRGHDEKVATLQDDLGQARSALERVHGELDQAKRDLEASRAEAGDRAELQEQVDALKRAAASRDAELASLRDALAARESDAERAAADAERMREALETQTSVTHQIKRSNGELRATLRTLREAHSAGLTDAHLVNQALLTEIEALRVAHDTDRAEMDEILSAMEPIMKEMQNA